MRLPLSPVQLPQTVVDASNSWQVVKYCERVLQQIISPLK